MLAHVLLTELPRRAASLAYVMAALIGLSAGGLVLFVIAARSPRRVAARPGTRPWRAWWGRPARPMRLHLGKPQEP